MTGPIIVYGLGVITSIVCALLLVRAYLRTRTRLILWSAIAFVLLSMNATLVFIDIVTPPFGNLLPYRQATSLGAVLVLIYGFMWEAE
jgi:hypothetical protein